jgi:hypothetical protein
VRALDALREVRRLGSRARKESERPVDVQPGVVSLREIGQGLDGVEVPRVHLAGVADDDRRRSLEIAKGRFHCREIHATGVIACEAAHGLAADAQHRERLRCARVDVAAREHGDGGQAREPARVDIDAMTFRPPRARRGESGEVRHRRAGREHAAP